MVSSSLFAYIADGKNGLRVVQLFSPQTILASWDSVRGPHRS